MNICVICSANNLSEKYTRPACELARLLAQNGDTLVWGGSNRGLMKIVADTAQAEGGKIIGVSVELFKHHAHTQADELIITKNLSERKATLLNRADAIVVLVGGLGTLDELTEIVELKREGEHTKPIIVLNTNGFYDGLKLQMDRIASEGLLPAAELEIVTYRSLAEYLQFVDTPQAVLSVLAKSSTPTQGVPLTLNM